MLLLVTCASAFGQAPVLFFSDLTSGPATGGEDGNGAYLTVYGNFLGSAQGSSAITVGGGELTNCKQWGSNWMALPSGQNWIQKITCQIGPAASTGNIVVTVNGQPSNALPFTVTPGNIYFVAMNGSDSNSGTFSSPWQTIPHAVEAAGAQAGSIIYVENGVTAETDDGQGWHAALTLRAQWCQGIPSAPTALIAYPGATVTIGTPTGQAPAYGIRGTDSTASPGACGGNWVFAGLTLRGPAPVLTGGPSDNWRWVGNDISNPQAVGGNGGGGAFEIQLSTHTKALGNSLHDLNLASTDRLQQGLYLCTDSNHSEIGWNLIQNSKGRTGFQIHSSPLNSTTGYILYDLAIHDNIIHDSAEECLIVDTVDPSEGPVSVYNNVLYNCGQDGSGDGALYRTESSDFNTSHGAGSGNVDMHNNTIVLPYRGAGQQSWFEVEDGQLLVDVVRNNLIYSPPGNPYWDPWKSGEGGDWRACTNTDTPATCPNFTGSNNLVFGAGAPSFTNLLSNNVNGNPNFVNLSDYDFHLQSNSPAIGAGAQINGLTYDIEGKLRGMNPSIGAFDVLGSGLATPALAALGCNPPSVTTPASIPCTVSLTGSAPSAGFAVTLSSNNLSLTVPASLTIPSGQSSGQFTASAAAVSSTGSAVVTSSSGGVTETFTLTLTPSITPSSLTCSPSSIASGGSAACTVTLSGPAPSGAATVTLSDNSAALSVPASVSVAASATSASFTASASSVSSGTSVVVTAIYNGEGASAKETITPGTSSALSSLGCSPASLTGAGSTVCTVSLTAAAPGGGAVVTLSGSSAALTAPASVSVPDGSTSATFNASATPVSSMTPVTLTATLGASSANTTISLNPPPPATSVSVSVTPPSVSLNGSQTQQFTAAVTGSTNTAVTWSLSSSVGTLSSTGLYTAPATIGSSQTVTVMATSAANTQKSAAATISLVTATTTSATSGSGYSVSYQLANGSLQVNWTAPSGRPPNDFIILTSPSAPAWWNVWMKYTNGATSGSFSVPAPTASGLYDLQYGLDDTLTYVAQSSTFTINDSVYSMSVSSPTVTSGSQMTISWTSPSGRPTGWSSDQIVIYQSGSGPDSPVWNGYTQGATSGVMSLNAPSAAGTYVVFYLPAGNNYITPVQPITLIVQ